MSIVHEHVASQGNSGVIVNAACAIGYVAHNHSQRISKPTCPYSQLSAMQARKAASTCAPFDNVRDRTCKHLQTLWHLQGDHLRVVLSNMMYSFVYFKGVVRWKLLDCCIELRVVQDILRDLICDY